MLTSPVSKKSLRWILPAMVLLFTGCPPAGDQVEKTIGPAGGTVVTPSRAAAVQIPAGALSQEVLVSIKRLPTPSSPGEGPLPTALRQYPPFYEFTTSPAVAQFTDSVRVGVCQVTDPGDPFYAPEESHSRLRLAHTRGGTIEILNNVAVTDLIACTDVPGRASTTNQPAWRVAVEAVGRIVGLVGPRTAFAAHGGLGGKVTSFSPFGAVDFDGGDPVPVPPPAP
ncbi:MAG: hypothetical protein ABIZ73_05880 [Gemmatimonadaceae bacterium]